MNKRPSTTKLSGDSFLLRGDISVHVGAFASSRSDAVDSLPPKCVWKLPNTKIFHKRHSSGPSSNRGRNNQLMEASVSPLKPLDLSGEGCAAEVIKVGRNPLNALNPTNAKVAWHEKLVIFR